ncbi:hypothetical protein BJ997_001842 [Cryobacterium roopkundense]|uniref:Uncharacterized protein n=1 Tax=Cryobacterium roopkundense TaxID=1001240 RepID=A0A7W8ZW44_9MICO|nr:hypothetical protein [Cryobacterium roopkundense]
MRNVTPSELACYTRPSPTRGLTELLFHCGEHYQYTDECLGTFEMT